MLQIAKWTIEELKIRQSVLLQFEIIHNLILLKKNILYTLSAENKDKENEKKRSGWHKYKIKTKWAMLLVLKHDNFYCNGLAMYRKNPGVRASRSH